MEQPRWLTAAWGELGVKETPGPGSNPVIEGYFRDAGQSRHFVDDTPWCAAFVGAMLTRAGEVPSGSLMARSYLGWGEALSEPRPGAIAVLSRGDDPAAGHTGFLLGMAGKRIFLLGGNQSDSVCVEGFDVGRVLAYRWPAAAAARPPTGIPGTGIFEKALAHVLKMEGGYTDDPFDPGGPTNFGITLSEYAAWRGATIDAASRADLIAALKKIPHDTVSAIYATRYWRPSGCPQLPDALAMMHFDAAVNHGTGTAIRLKPPERMWMAKSGRERWLLCNPNRSSRR